MISGSYAHWGIDHLNTYTAQVRQGARSFGIQVVSLVYSLVQDFFFLEPPRIVPALLFHIFYCSMLPVLIPFLLTSALAAVLSDRQTLAGSNVCDQIASSISGQVYTPLDLTLHYSQDIEHFMSSSSENPMCVVEVTGTEDVSAVMKIVASTRTPFAVKSGGHASNPGFSSTTGVHISLAKLTQIILSEDKTTIELGMGNVGFHYSKFDQWSG